MKEVADFIEAFRKLWDDRFNKLESIMKNIKQNNRTVERKTKINAEDGKQELVITRNLICLWNYFSEHMQSPTLLNNGWERKC